MVHFRDRYDVIEWIIATTPRRSILRAMEEGRIEFLGAFEELPPDGLSGWILNVESPGHNTEFVIGVIPDLESTKAILFNHIPWTKYKGGTSELNQGDDPEEYKLLRKKEYEKRKNT